MGTQHGMSITAAGVGIGTTIPTAALSVVGGRHDSYVFRHQVGCHLGQASNYSFLELCNSAGGQIDFASGDGNNDFNGRINYTHSDNKMIFYTDTTTRMVIDDSGNVGINRTNPGEKLEVDGNIRLTGNLLMGGYVSDGTPSKIRIGSYNDDRSDVGTQDALVYIGGDHDLTGTLLLLQVSDYNNEPNNDKVVLFKSENNNEDYYFQANTSGGKHYYRGTIECNGGIVGNLTGDVNGSLTGNAATATKATKLNITSNASPADYHVPFMGVSSSDGTFHYNSSNYIKINPNTGRVGIGGTSTSYKLYVAGTIGATDDITAFHSSDKRLKKPYSYQRPFRKIKKINGYTFVWKENEHHSNKGNDVGVIAQEIEEILPEITTTRENGYKAVRYEKLTPFLISCIKEQQTQIKSQQTIESQQTQISSLQSQIDELKALIKNN